MNLMKKSYIIICFAFSVMLCNAQNVDFTDTEFTKNLSSLHILSNNYSDSTFNSFSDELLLDRPYYSLSIDSVIFHLTNNFRMLDLDKMEDWISNKGYGMSKGYFVNNQGEILRVRIGDKFFNDIDNDKHYLWNKKTPRGSINNWMENSKESLTTIFNRNMSNNEFVKIENNKIAGTDGYDFQEIKHDLPSDTFIIIKSGSQYIAKVFEHEKKWFEFEIIITDTLKPQYLFVHPITLKESYHLQDEITLTNSGESFIGTDLSKNEYDFLSQYEVKNYVNGKVQGERIVYNNREDTLLVEYFIDGYKSGLASYYNEDGSIRETIDWKVGIIDSVKYVDPITLEDKMRYVKGSFKD